MIPVIGFDYSMTSPAMCVCLGENYYLYGFCSLKVEKTYHIAHNMNFRIGPNVESYESPIERFDKLARKFMLELNKLSLPEGTKVYIEGYSMGSKGQVFNIAENTAILKHYLYRSELPVIEVAPTTVKKFATGKGNAQKEDMHDAFVKQTGIDLKGILTPNRKLGSPVTDLIDAYYIALYGKALLHKEQN